MTDKKILHNECEQAMLILENAFLKYMGDSKSLHSVANIADGLGLGFDSAALGRAIAKRLEGKGLVKINQSWSRRWSVQMCCLNFKLTHYRTLAVDVQRRQDAVGDDAGSGPRAGRTCRGLEERASETGAPS